MIVFREVNQLSFGKYVIKVNHKNTKTAIYRCCPGVLLSKFEEVFIYPKVVF